MNIHCYKSVYVPPNSYVGDSVSNVTVYRSNRKHLDDENIGLLYGLMALSKELSGVGEGRDLSCPTLGHLMTRSEGPCGPWPLSLTSQIPRL